METKIEYISVGDLPKVQEYASDESLGNTSNVPSPYPPEGAWTWYRLVQTKVRAGESVVFAIHHDGFAGVLSLNSVNVERKCCEVDFWVARPYWGLGICTAAVGQALLYAKHILELDTAFSACLERNPGSGRVLQKSGFEEIRRFTNSGEFGSKFLEPMIRYRKQLQPGASPCPDPKLCSTSAAS